MNPIYLGNRLVAIKPGWSGTGLAMSEEVQVEIIDGGGVIPLGPEITRLNPTAAPVGTEVTITGLNFGANRGSSTVTFNGTPVTVYLSWSDTSIEVEVPTGAATGNVVVTVSGKPPSNGYRFMVTHVPPSCRIWATPPHIRTGGTSRLEGKNRGRC